jgi:hypothetical protein
MSIYMDLFSGLADIAIMDKVDTDGVRRAFLQHIRNGIPPETCLLDRHNTYLASAEFRDFLRQMSVDPSYSLREADHRHQPVEALVKSMNSWRRSLPNKETWWKEWPNWLFQFNSVPISGSAVLSRGALAHSVMRQPSSLMRELKTAIVSKRKVNPVNNGVVVGPALLAVRQKTRGDLPYQQVEVLSISEDGHMALVNYKGTVSNAPVRDLRPLVDIKKLSNAPVASELKSDVVPLPPNLGHVAHLAVPVAPDMQPLPPAVSVPTTAHAIHAIPSDRELRAQRRSTGVSMAPSQVERAVRVDDPPIPVHPPMPPPRVPIDPDSVPAGGALYARDDKDFQQQPGKSVPGSWVVYRDGSKPFVGLLLQDGKDQVQLHTGIVKSSLLQSDWLSVKDANVVNSVSAPAPTGWKKAEYVISARSILGVFHPTDGSRIPLQALQLIADYKRDPYKFPFKN